VFGTNIIITHIRGAGKRGGGGSEEGRVVLSATSPACGSSPATFAIPRR